MRLFALFTKMMFAYDLAYNAVLAFYKAKVLWISNWKNHISIWIGMRGVIIGFEQCDDMWHE